MHHDPFVVKPTAPQTGQAPPPNASTNPDAAFAKALMDSRNKQSVAHRIPRLKMSAYILLALIVLSVLQTVAMGSIYVAMLGSGPAGPDFFTIPTILGWAIAAAGAITILNTKSAKLAKRILLAVGLCLAYFLVTALISLDIIGAAIDGFILWWTYGLYQSVEALEIQPNP